jgi:predicted signal transduction protein with EAL and GGDEF domain
VGIVAEGVETPEQADFLTAHGCDEAQGYHLGRPMPEAAFADLLMAHSRERSGEAPRTTRPAVAAVQTPAPDEARDPCAESTQA